MFVRNPPIVSQQGPFRRSRSRSRGYLCGIFTSDDMRYGVSNLVFGITTPVFRHKITRDGN